MCIRYTEPEEHINPKEQTPISTSIVNEKFYTEP